MKNSIQWFEKITKWNKEAKIESKSMDAIVEAENPEKEVDVVQEPEYHLKDITIAHRLIEFQKNSGPDMLNRNSTNDKN